MIEVATAYGPARLDIDQPATDPLSLLVLGHGAGGGVDAVDLLAVRDAAVASRVTVARVTQPYRVAGRRAPAPASQLDRAFVAVVAAARALVPVRVPLIVGGRSSGARVACRTAAELGAAGVLALAFPLHPPGKPDRSRAGELPAQLPTLVVNGDRDPFGVPTASGLVDVRVRAGETHDLRRDPAAVAAVAVGWLVQNGWAAARP
ncbi:alpha/beta hydrolase [Planosporangium flavigriseum]|uniref:Alpha/beta hydrolase n=1 Tax=Planosporangium flavigriseum TaxID=373681 RepID=A0A8J3LQK7_9ACTN|nr:alpha/beta family hydrolase [Planosporangium flavigriseum]NJC66681.1 alpha/beta hydrolase [Planosporangium flavigriseum]GIG74833.1 alpha/beta hydrolase [Planosporangium flavigriseum]